MKKTNHLFFQYTNEFLNIYLKKQTGKSINTIESYRDALTVFRKYLLEIKQIKIMNFKIEDCTKALVLDFIEYLKSNNRKNSTINHHITAIKSYLWYISDCDLTYQSIAISISHIPQLKVGMKEKDILSNEVLMALFNEPAKNRKGLRNQVIMIMLYETALRVGELINLKINDIFLDISTPYILVHGKGDKERLVSLSSKCVDHLKNYLLVFKPENYLFYTVIKGKTGKLSESTIETFIQKYADSIREKCPDLSVPTKVHPHMFRRSRATHLYQDDIPIEMVSRMLGHSNTDTTRKHYAKPSLEQMKKVIENENDVDIQAEWESEDELAKLLGLR